MTLLIFQILSSVFGFVNKVLLLSEKRSGWAIGFLAGIFFIIYFFLIGFTIYAIIQIGFTLLMLYGYFSHNEVSRVGRVAATTVLSLVAIVIAIITFNGQLTFLEALSALVASWGTYFIASHQHQIGWAMYLFAHLILVYLTFLKQQYLFSFFQLASAVVAIFAIKKFKYLEQK